MAGHNLIILPNGKRRCRACFSDTRKRLRREDTLRRKAGFSEPLDDLSLEQLYQRREQAKVMLETAEKALDAARKSKERQKAKFEKTERQEQKALEIYHAAVKLVEQIDQLYLNKANEEGTF